MKAHNSRIMFPLWGNPTPSTTDLQSFGEIRPDLDTSTQSSNSSLVACSVANTHISQPFGSMPWRINSARAKAFSQLPRLTPSRLAASFNCWRNSGVMRIWKVGDRPSPLGVLSLLMVDMYVRNLIVWILLCTYVSTTYLQKATPRSGGTLPRRLTTNDRLSIEVAMSDHITPLTGRNSHTPNKFTWRFLALSRIDCKAKPCRLSVVATTEREARQVLAPYFILSLAARLPVREVSHV